MMEDEEEIAEGLEYDVRIDAKDARGGGIGRVGNFVVLIRNAKTRIGNSYRVRITKVHRTFAYGELKGAIQLVGGSRVVL